MRLPARPYGTWEAVCFCSTGYQLKNIMCFQEIERGTNVKERQEKKGREGRGGIIIGLI